MKENSEPLYRGRVTTDYQRAYPDPIVMTKGEELKVGQEDVEWIGWVWCTSLSGKSGWVPKNYIKQEGDRGVALVDYNASELSVHAGDELNVHKEESGWVWSTNASGESGWVPAKHIEKLG